jgi:hypothetical protein
LANHEHLRARGAAGGFLARYKQLMCKKREREGESREITQNYQLKKTNKLIKQVIRYVAIN